MLKCALRKIGCERSLGIPGVKLGIMKILNVR